MLETEQLGTMKKLLILVVVELAHMAAFVKTRNIIDSATNSGSTADVDITDEYDATLSNALQYMWN